jgi:hypothetical protein
MLSTKAAALQAHRLVFTESSTDDVYMFDMDYVISGISFNDLIIKISVAKDSDWFKWAALRD